MSRALPAAATLEDMIDIESIVAVGLALAAAALFAAMAWANAHHS